VPPSDSSDSYLDSEWASTMTCPSPENDVEDTLSEYSNSASSDSDSSELRQFTCHTLSEPGSVDDRYFTLCERRDPDQFSFDMDIPWFLGLSQSERLHYALSIAAYILNIARIPPSSD
jgi:hypothetical protein